MENIELERTPPSNKSSEDDINRKELLWENREEIQILKWKEIMILKKNNHNNNGKLNKKLYYIFGIPTIIIPLILGSLNGVVELNEITFTFLMIANSIVAGLNTFMNFSKKSRLHFEFSSKYAEVIVDIDKELSIPKAHRLAADVFIEQIVCKFNSMNNYAPV